MSTLMSLSNHFYCLSLTCFLVIGQVSSSFSDGITSESCYSLHQSSGNGTVIPPILCDSGACNGLRLNVIGVSDGYYTCDSEYEGIRCKCTRKITCFFNSKLHDLFTSFRV